jgi:[ribosomal protein S18]-alanine N-acetyltransferase
VSQSARPSTKFSLRDFVPDDFETLWKLDQVCFTRGIAYSKPELAHYLKQPRAFTIVAEAEGKIQGFIVIGRDLKQTGRIITIDVHPGSQRTGLGTSLMNAAEERLLELKAQRIILEVAVDNLPALAFYKRHGYAVVKTIPRYYMGSLDALRMEKKISG